jgi:predicted HTH transcriptional regulator
MEINSDQINTLLHKPSEGLQVEVKTWLDPRKDSDIAKIIKAIFAIRNRNGGFLIIGFNNTTMEPDYSPSMMTLLRSIIST